MSAATLIAGVSGGRTSAMMALRHVPQEAVLCFQNTGREHPGTLDFLRLVEDAAQRPIVRLEFRAPPRGKAPGAATFEIVSHDQLARNGEPFIDMLECVAAYRRAVKGLGPIAPWARSRICTAYLKIRTQEKYVASLGWSAPTVFVGLRADEPGRVANMRQRAAERDTGEVAPLFDAGIEKRDVLAFWRSMPFDLEIPEHLGNCTGCFLKDEADLATALLEPETDAAWWIAIEKKYAPMRRGRSSYEQVLAEAPERMKIREQIARDQTLLSSALPLRRHELVVKQELRREESSFSCHCEGAEKVTDRMILDLPEAA